MPTALQRITYVRNANANTWVQPEALNVTPDLLGVPLARPLRRAMAMAVDGVVIVLLSSTGTFWVPAGMAALVFQMRRRHAAHARVSVWLWFILAALVFLAGWHTIDYIQHRQPGAKTGTAVLAESDDDDDDEAIVRTLLQHQPDQPVPADAAASAAIVAAETAARHDARSAARRIAKLEAELAELRKPQVERWRNAVVKAAHSAGLGFGWAIAYFTLLPFWWKGQTLGKKLFGLRTVELTGKPLSLMGCFGRYGGYAAGLATGGIGFAQVLWDPNRQAVQDKIAHTVVVDLREPRREAAAAPLTMPAEAGAALEDHAPLPPTDDSSAADQDSSATARSQ